MILEEKIRRLLCVFENDNGSPEMQYGAIYIYSDGLNGRKQVTLSFGATSDGGALQKVLRRYITKNGERSDFLRARLTADTPALVADKEFLQMLGTVSTEPAMREAQDEIFNEVYLQPAYAWATKYNFESPLSIAIICDSFLHSGTMLGFLMNRFPDKKPLNGGDEHRWMEAYIQVRHRWLANHSNKILRNTIYRTRFFQGEIRKGNWGFDAPLVANDVKIA